MSNNVQSVTAKKLLYTAAETMIILSVNKRQLYHLVNRGLLVKHPGFKNLMFKVTDVETFAAMGQAHHSGY